MLKEFENKILLMTKERFDRCIFRIANMLCMFPVYDFKKEELRFQKLNKVYAILHLIVQTMLMIFYNLPLPKIFKTEKPLQVFGDLLTVGLMCILTFNIVCLKSQNWTIFFRKLLQLEPEYCKERQKEMKLFYFHFILGHAMFIAVYAYCFSEVQEIPDLKMKIFIFEEVMPEYYYFFLSLMLSNLILMIKFQYVKICNDIEEFFSRPTALKYESLVLHKILQTGRMFRTTTELTEMYNEMEGWNMVMVFLHSIIRILRAGNWIMILAKVPQLNTHNCFAIFFITLLIVVSNIFICLHLLYT